MTEEATVVQEIDYGFFDSVNSGGYEDLIGQDSSQGGEGVEFFPMSYANTPGTYTFRIYPENYNGRPRFLREVWSNKLVTKDEEGKEKFFRVVTKREDNRIKDIIEGAKENGLTGKKNGAWKHSAMRNGVLMVHMYKCPDNKYIKQGSTGLVLQYKQLDSLKAFLQSIEESGSNLLDFLDPRKSSPGIVMTISGKGKDQKTTISVTGGPMSATKLELPAMKLPAGHNYDGLDSLYVAIDAYPTDDQIEGFKEYINEAVEEYLDYKAASEDPETALESGYDVDSVNVKTESESEVYSNGMKKEEEFLGK